MTPWIATVIKLKTADGYFEFQPGQAHIGKEFNVDLDSRTKARAVHQPSGKEFTAEVVECLDFPANQEGRFLPVELLEL